MASGDEEDEEFQSMVSDLVYDELGDSLPQATTREMCLLDVNKSEAERERSIDSQVAFLMAQLCAYYGLTDRRDVKAVEGAVQRAVVAVNKILVSYSVYDPAKLKRFRAAFNKRYVGDSHKQFYGYLARCWSVYKANRTKYASPYGTLVQSSGFGKSRMLQEVAKLAAKDDEVSPGVQMRVLYICTSNKTSGFPLATPDLREWFFNEKHTEADMKSRLLHAFNYANDNWGVVGREWLRLFTEKPADENVADQLEAEPMEVDTGSGRVLRSMTKTGGRLLVLVVDEARLLFDLKEPHGVDFFHLLCRALTAANNELQSRGGGIFGVFVDTNSKVHDFLPPLQMQSSAEQNIDMLFPPFVLTHTMDVFWRQEKKGDYKTSVIQTGAKKK